MNQEISLLEKEQNRAKELRERLGVLTLEKLFDFGCKWLVYPNVPENRYIISPYGDLYEVNDFGQVKQLKPALTFHKSRTDEYYGYNICHVDGTKKHRRTHRLVAYTFLGAPPVDIKNATVDHIDRNHFNNHYSNLRWVSNRINSHISSKVTADNLASTDAEFLSKIHEACKLLQLSADIAFIKIGNLTGLSAGIISDIYYGKIYVEISKNYVFKKRKDKVIPRKVSWKLQKKIILACDLLMRGKYSFDEIGVMTNLSRTTISSIYHHTYEPLKDYISQFNFPLAVDKRWKKSIYEIVPYQEKVIQLF